MDNLGLVHIELMNYLLLHENSDLSTLSKVLKCSNRKVQLDIKLINDELQSKNIGAKIINSRNQGYTWEFECDRVRKQFIQQTNSYLNLSMVRFPSDSTRTQALARELLLAKRFVKSEILARKFNISQGTLSADLREVRRLLSHYDIYLESKPYYGLEVKGTPMSRISALLDLMDWFDTNQKECLFYPWSLYQGGIDADILNETKSRVAGVLNEWDYKVSPSGFRRIVLLLEFLKSELFTNLNTHSLNGIERYQEYKISREILGESKEEKVLCLTYYLIANMDFSSEISEKTHYKLYLDSTALLNKLSERLKSETNLDLEDTPLWAEEMTVYLMRFSIRRNMSIKEFNTNTALIDIVDTIPASQSLATKITLLLDPHANLKINDSQYYELTMMIYNIAYLHMSDYDIAELLVINDFGHYANKSVIRHLNLGRFYVNYTHKSSYELEYIDLTEYDGIISNSDNEDLTNSPIPVIETSYFKSNEITSDFWTKIIMKRRKSNLILEQLKSKQSLVINETTVTLISRLCEILMQEGINIPDAFNELSLLINHQKGMKENDVLMLCLLWPSNENTSRFSITLEHTMEINFRMIERIELVILNPGKNMLSIKQADSSLRRI